MLQIFEIITVHVKNLIYNFLIRIEAYSLSSLDETNVKVIN
jgi:hypothetical protein